MPQRWAGGVRGTAPTPGVRGPVRPHGLSTDPRAAGRDGFAETRSSPEPAPGTARRDDPSHAPSLLRSQLAAGFWPRTLCRAGALSLAWLLPVHTVFRTGSRDAEAQMSQGAGTGALGIPPHAHAGVPTSLSICRGSGGLSTLARAVPVPRSAAEVVWVEGCSWPRPHGPDP